MTDLHRDLQYRSLTWLKNRVTGRGMLSGIEVPLNFIIIDAGAICRLQWRFWEKIKPNEPQPANIICVFQVKISRSDFQKTFRKDGASYNPAMSANLRWIVTPKNLVTAPTLTKDQLDDLRVQLDLSYMDPEYSIVTNYEVNWEQIGADQRLLDLANEYENIENQVFAAMGVTRELLTGEGSFSGNKITVEILNTMFLLMRTVLTEYTEQQLFVPVCEAHGWYEDDKYGFRHYWYPRLGFNRLTIRDNAEVFDSLFQLYQKGSLPVDVIYELFNLDADTLHEKLKDDLFTVKDPNFNRIVEDASSEVGRALAEKTDVLERVAKYMGLEVKEGGEEEGGGFGDFGGFGGDEEFGDEEAEPEAPEEGEEEEGPAEGIADQAAQQMQAIVQKAVEELGTEATDDEIRQKVQELAEVTG